MIKILISACLLGERVRYHGGDAALSDVILDRWRREGRLVPFCPEVAGGLSVQLMVLMGSNVPVFVSVALKLTLTICAVGFHAAVQLFASVMAGGGAG